ncbi:polysaccharide lyase family 8 super-sandwich domain-containing protein [Phytohabitans rumicis]|uniref:Hyaluronate lyase n=1 Tax=Phytohabitans rumicis TaxID=1076125 RepID=A0A6V8KWB3_9ACTN|nr:polysaccharide lyase family 8 super-sandwich domain-containing protein [Phytohabitans rumicis]GFJ89372.1 hyaluronate lyase [Phytohabitans rumicis]
MQVSRRAVLSTVPAAALLAAVGARPATAAVSADFATLMDNMVAMFAGTAESSAHPDVAAKLATIDSTARTWLTAMDQAGPGELFAGWPLGTSDTNLKRTSQSLYEIALATRVPGSALHGDAVVQRRVVDGLARMHGNYYGDQAKGYYGNWFNWEIGISTDVSRTLVLLAAELGAYRPDLAATYVASMDAYLRNGSNGDVDLNSRFHTGANLADITANRILQGAVLGDGARVAKAVADQLTVFATVDPYNLQHGVTDGYYADGSFIQHSSVAYTGSYGKALLTRVVQTIKTLDGTSVAHGDDLMGVVQGWVANGFAPLIFEGYLMEIVKGRAVSRTGTGYADVAQVIEAVVDLSGYARGTDATALRGYVKYLRQSSRASINPTTFVSPVSIVRYADVLADASTVAKDLSAAERSVAFNAMDKHVHRRPGYAFALARSSSRISKYEYMNGENLMPWFQGDGAHYLYLSGQDQTLAYGVDHYTTVSPYRLAGVTAPVESRRTIPQLYGTMWYENPALGFTSSSESQNRYVYFPRGTNAFSGGAVLGAYGVAGLVQSDDFAYAAKQAGDLPDDFVAYRNAGATKSWFMFDNEVVVLAAGVGDGAGRAVTTTVDSRIAAVSDEVVLGGARRDGAAWAGTGTARLAWLRYANATLGTSVGYVFLDHQRATVSLDEVTASRRVVRLSNPDVQVSKRVFSVGYEQPAGAAPTAMAYAIVPNASGQQLRAYAGGPVDVLVNTTRVQAVKHRGLGLTGANAFAAGLHHAGQLAIEGPASVIVRTTSGGVTSVAVSDPTMQRDTVVLTVRGRTMRVMSADPAVRVRPCAGGTRIEVATRHAYGRTFTATLH